MQLNRLGILSTLNKTGGKPNFVQGQRLDDGVF